MNTTQFSRRRAAPWAVLLLLALLLASCAGATDAANRGADPGAQAPAAAATPNPTPTPIVVSTPAAQPADRRQGLAGLTYNGEIIAERIVPVVAEVAGQIVEVAVEVGSDVKTGDLLVRLDSSVQEAQRAQAMAGLEAAQAQLDLATAKPSATDLEAARAAVAAAEAAYNRALKGPTDEEKRMALAQLRQAEAAVQVYQAQYDRIAGSPVAAMLPESLQLQQATLAKEAAQAQYDKVLKGATADQIAGAYAQLANARAQLARLEEGAKPAQINALKANVKAAETALYLAQLQVDKTTIKAPTDGYIYQLDATKGAMAGPGKALAVIFSHEMKIQIAVEEARATEVRLDQPATIRVDAYPDRTFRGKVTAIAPAFDPATRTVKVTVRPTDEDAQLLKPGMFATVQLEQ
ncbi:MAG: HlyD family secretion protein [Anaerolineae bacterium]